MTWQTKTDLQLKNDGLFWEQEQFKNKILWKIQWLRLSKYTKQASSGRVSKSLLIQDFPWLRVDFSWAQSPIIISVNLKKNNPWSLKHRSQLKHRSSHKIFEPRPPSLWALPFLNGVSAPCLVINSVDCAFPSSYFLQVGTPVLKS